MASKREHRWSHDQSGSEGRSRYIQAVYIKSDVGQRMAIDNPKGADRLWVRGQGEEEGKNMNEARLHLDFEWIA